MNCARSCSLALLTVISLLTACGIVVPADKSGYVGEWQGDTVRLSIETGGEVRYERRQGNLTKSVSGQLQEFQGDDFVVGMVGVTAVFRVQNPPKEVDGIWTMVVDGEQLIKNEPGAQETLSTLEQSAAGAAKSFVEILDARDALSSWHQLDADSQKQTPLAQWTALLEEWRSLYGQKDQRQLQSTAYTQSVEKGPIAHYFTFVTKTSFSNGARALERVMMMKDREGGWRVADYEISRLGAAPQAAQVPASQTAAPLADTAPVRDAPADPAQTTEDETVWESSPPPERESRREYVAMPVDSLAGYVNEPVRIRTTDGVDHLGRLFSSSDDRLTIRKWKSNGTIDFEIMYARIDKAEVMREVSY